tara:strand:- start:222 stop:1313 length:1092 start_codon:yes stop_codon:yes gene_type:complete
MCGGGGGGSVPTLNANLFQPIKIDPNLGENLNQALAPIETAALTDSLSKIPDLTDAVTGFQEGAKDFFDSGGSLMDIPQTGNIPETILDIGDRFDPTDNTGGGFGLPTITVPTLDEIKDKVSDSTPDLIIDTTGLTDLTQGIATGITDTSAVVGETVGGITTDILQGDLGTVMTDATETVGDFITNPLGTTQEILDHNLGDTGLKGAIDQTVDFVKNPSKVIKDAGDRAENFGKDVGEQLTETGENYKEVITDIGETAEEIGEVATETQTTGMETVTQAGENAATQVTQAEDDLINALVAAGLLSRKQAEEDGVGNAEAIMAGDPRMLSLMARRNRARKRGKAQLRKGGGLYIPVGSGLQVPA